MFLLPLIWSSLYLISVPFLLCSFTSITGVYYFKEQILNYIKQILHLVSSCPSPCYHLFFSLNVLLPFLGRIWPSGICYSGICYSFSCIYHNKGRPITWLFCSKVVCMEQCYWNAFTLFTFAVFEQYQRARTQFVQTVAELATRPQNIETLQNAGKQTETRLSKWVFSLISLQAS